ncbi:MAG: hypothetical protein P4L90_15270 [Rhodopila sp.]|nr:hypothetical protein [Rhodopila sp.]
MPLLPRAMPAVWTMLTVLAVIGLPRSVVAQPVPNTAEAGKKLAEQYCVTCHVITPSATKGWTDAPTFAAIANRPGVTAAQLSAVAQKPHMNMLNDRRPKDEADAMATYILSLRRH